MTRATLPPLRAWSARTTLAAAICALALLLAAAPARGQASAPPAAQSQPAADHAAPAAGDASDAHAGAHADDAGHDESIWPQIGKIVNFAILVGTIVYFARRPVAEYLAGRRAQVRADLVEAEALKTAAAAQIAEMDAKLAALPAELDALRARGQDEIAAELRRIEALADAERQRLIDQASREIDQKVRMARRELIEHAATLAVSTARQKIDTHITDADRARLVDRYLTEVRRHE
jgi:F0F1-type ATP synthase membrane subunit b/b'